MLKSAATEIQQVGPSRVVTLARLQNYQGTQQARCIIPIQVCFALQEGASIGKESPEWHTANPDYFNNAAPNLYNDTASRNSKTRISGRPQKKLKGRLGEVLCFGPHFIADIRPVKP
ncbi:hypothetical protein BCON_0248g00110 [Botryotinia convoluta]|uniref:Uncharacterized protein n=1 Tax=Botryotinia convoluta TaxID=54673 RepID=A0A4Z1HTP7_9HELO|nr:hypothetical protein BCON_0248g00110 [Botryotinia convoluta]